jgi:hypothetical protein
MTLDDLPNPLESVRRRAELLGGVHDRALAEQEQPGQLPRLEDRALPVLSRHDDGDLTGRPAAIGALTHRHPQRPTLPRHQHQAIAGREVRYLVP